MSNYLIHYGVLGMKWGVQKARETTNATKVASKKKTLDDAKVRLAAAKARKGVAAKDWNRSANQINSATRMWTKSGDAILDTARNNANKSGKADDSYKNAKKSYKQAKKDYKSEIRKDNEAYANDSSKKKFLDSLVTNDAGRRQINRLLNENKNLTVDQARQTTYIETGINTAAVLLALYGASKMVR